MFKMLIWENIQMKSYEIANGLGYLLHEWFEWGEKIQTYFCWSKRGKKGKFDKYC